MRQVSICTCIHSLRRRMATREKKKGGRPEGPDKIEWSRESVCERCRDDGNRKYEGEGRAEI